MTLRMTLRWWWARLPGTTIARPQAFKKSALILEAAHINRQLLRRLDDPPVTRAERRRACTVALSSRPLTESPARRRDPLESTPMTTLGWKGPVIE
jgi:hypothetical protein